MGKGAIPRPGPEGYGGQGRASPQRLFLMHRPEIADKAIQSQS